MRKVVALVATVVLLGTLSACAPSISAQLADANPATCTPATKDGASASAVEATGEIGTAPVVTFPTPLTGGGLQRHEAVVGTGATVEKGTLVSIAYSLYNGKDGSLLNQAGYDGAPTAVYLGDSATLSTIITDGLACSTIGSRVVLTLPASATLSTGDTSSLEQAGLTPDDSLVYIFDVLGSSLARAQGTPQPAVAGLPAVVLGPTGAPGIIVPSTPAPTEYTTEVTIKGDGDVTTSDQNVAIQYTKVNWDSKEVVTSTWTGVTDEATGAVIAPLSDESVPAAITNAIVGQTVGSQVLAVDPSDAEGTMIYVIDILGSTF